MAIFIEDDEDVARRMEGRTIEQQKLVFRQVDYDTVTLLTLFEYMIGNTDMSMYLLHNVILVQTPGRVTFPVPYDFDYSGLVDARYAIPAKQFNLTSVRDRIYRGPCRTAAELQPFFEKFQAKKTEILALFDSIPGLDANYRKDSQKYIEAFFQTMCDSSYHHCVPLWLHVCEGYALHFQTMQGFLDGLLEPLVCRLSEQFL